MATMVNGKPWTCPHCGGHDLEEVDTEMTVTAEVLEVKPGGCYELGETTDMQAGGGSKATLYCAACHEEIDLGWLDEREQGDE